MDHMEKINEILVNMQEEMHQASREFLKNNTHDIHSLADVKNRHGGWLRGNWCGSGECEKSIKDETGGIEIRGRRESELVRLPAAGA